MDVKHCDSCPDHPEEIFCPMCGKADKVALRSVRLAGFVGVLHSTSPKIEEFWASGDPDVFVRP